MRTHQLFATGPLLLCRLAGAWQAWLAAVFPVGGAAAIRTASKGQQATSRSSRPPGSRCQGAHAAKVGAKQLRCQPGRQTEGSSRWQGCVCFFHVGARCAASGIGKQHSPVSCVSSSVVLCCAVVCREMPTQAALLAAGRADLVNLITKVGGFSQVQEALSNARAQSTCTHATHMPGHCLTCWREVRGRKSQRWKYPRVNAHRQYCLASALPCTRASVALSITTCTVTPDASVSRSPPMPALPLF